MRAGIRRLRLIPALIHCPLPYPSIASHSTWWIDQPSEDMQHQFFRAAASTQTTVGEISNYAHLTHRFFL